MSVFVKSFRLLTFVFLSSGSFFVCAAQVVNMPAASEIVKEFDVVLIPGLNGQKFLMLKEESGSTTRSLMLIAVVDGQQSVIVKAASALPLIKNSYSPASYDGFEVGVLNNPNKTISVVDAQAETTLFKYGSAKAGDTLYLNTKEEDNTKYNFNLQFQYDAQAGKIIMSRLLLVNNNESCDRSLVSVYAVPSNILMSNPLETFSGAEAFEYLKKLHVDAQSSEGQREKLMSVTVASNFDQALAAYKKGDKVKFKEYMSYLVSDGGEDESCAPETYVVEKYYYPDMVGWSNDLGFLFSEAGYYGEAIELLKKVVAENSDRVVAYLNLADAYWGANNKDLSVENYKKYSALMQQLGRSAKIPKRVGERS
ncbi:tetratricopeptide repeat protein [Pseudomonas sp. MDT1-17]